MKSMAGTALDHLEELIDELIKDNPEETIVRLHMKAAGIRYTTDPVSRMSLVLEALEAARAISASTPKSLSKLNGQTNGTARGKDL